MTPTPTPLERFASVIRIADGNHDLGAASLAEAIIDLLPEFALRLVPANAPVQRRRVAPSAATGC